MTIQSPQIEDDKRHQLFRLLPSVNDLLLASGCQTLFDTHPRNALLLAARKSLAELRLEICSGQHTEASLQEAIDHLPVVIANHLESNAPIVLEGDFILPALAAQTMFDDQPNAGQVRAVFLYEEDEAQILNNFLQREPASGPQHKRAHVSWLYGQWLKTEAERYGLVALPARPWDNLFERVLAAVSL